jgi:hypothetical protein
MGIENKIRQESGGSSTSLTNRYQTYFQDSSSFLIGLLYL